MQSFKYYLYKFKLCNLRLLLIPIILFLISSLFLIFIDSIVNPIPQKGSYSIRISAGPTGYNNRDLHLIYDFDKNKAFLDFDLRSKTNIQHINIEHPNFNILKKSILDSEKNIINFDDSGSDKNRIVISGINLSDLKVNITFDIGKIEPLGNFVLADDQASSVTSGRTDRFYGRSGERILFKFGDKYECISPCITKLNTGYELFSTLNIMDNNEELSLDIDIEKTKEDSVKQVSLGLNTINKNNLKWNERIENLLIGIMAGSLLSIISSINKNYNLLY